jgi:hypothetical protein
LCYPRDERRINPSHIRPELAAVLKTYIKVSYILAEKSASKLSLPSQLKPPRRIILLIRFKLSIRLRNLAYSNTATAMRFTPTLLSALTFSLTGVNAIITGVTAPATITAGEPFIVSLTTANFIQTVYDVSVAFGVTPGSGFPDSLGVVFASAYLGPTLSNTLDTLRFTVQIPASTPVGTTLLSAAVTSLLGAEAEPVIQTYNVTVTVAH